MFFFSNLIYIYSFPVWFLSISIFSILKLTVVFKAYDEQDLRYNNKNKTKAALGVGIAHTAMKFWLQTVTK